jgi:hypothetical protein
MSIPIEITKVIADEITVAEILESWTIEEFRQLVEEIDAELRSRPTWHRGALRSRRAIASRRLRRRTAGAESQ